MRSLSSSTSLPARGPDATTIETECFARNPSRCDRVATLRAVVVLHTTSTLRASIGAAVRAVVRIGCTTALSAPRARSRTRKLPRASPEQARPPAASLSARTICGAS
jgi:hypothetical protein